MFSYDGGIFHQGIVILDYGSQYTLVIARKLRSLGVYCEIIAPSFSKPQLKFDYKGIILSGGPDSISNNQSRELCSWVFDQSVPIIGICYGMQLLMNHFGAKIRSDINREYGKAELTINTQINNEFAKKLYKGIKTRHTVWMSHGDDIDILSNDLLKKEFSVIGQTSSSIASVINSKRPIIGLQYHPEVEHTDYGDRLLSNFAFEICMLKDKYDSGCVLKNSINNIKNIVKDKRVCLACSGGVDSTVSFVLLTKALSKDQVVGVFVDNGLLRFDDLQVIDDLSNKLDLNIHIIDAKNKFYRALENIEDPEQKRKIIGKVFIDVFSDFAKNYKNDFEFLCQGTLYSDVIESGHGGIKPQVIKSHHNVGGLPENLPFKLIEPMRYLFKDEVRSLGKKLNIPDNFIYKHPFPGPGLAVRIAGEVNENQINILKHADKIFIDLLKEHDVYDKVWQAFAVLLPVKSVGVMGDCRTYEQVISLRAVLATDAMTAKVAELDVAFLTLVAERIVSNVKGINRVLYDVTTKPPATIEWQ